MSTPPTTRKRRMQPTNGAERSDALACPHADCAHLLSMGDVRDMFAQIIRRQEATEDRLDSWFQSLQVTQENMKDGLNALTRSNAVLSERVDKVLTGGIGHA